MNVCSFCDSYAIDMSKNKLREYHLSTMCNHRRQMHDLPSFKGKLYVQPFAIKLRSSHHVVQYIGTSVFQILFRGIVKGL